MQFRRNALSKLQAPEELDVPVRFARPQGRLVLAVTVIVMAAAGVWALTGTVTSKLTAPGLLTHAEGTYLLQSPVSGQVTEVLTEEGRAVAPGAPVLTVRTDRGDRPVRAVAGGRVTTLHARLGSVLTTGADVAAVERVTDPDAPWWPSCTCRVTPPRRYAWAPGSTSASSPSRATGSACSSAGSPPSAAPPSRRPSSAPSSATRDSPHASPGRATRSRSS